MEAVNVSIYNFSDATMLQKMANENSLAWRQSMRVVNETVWAAKVFLDDLLDEFETLEERVSHADDRPHGYSFFSGMRTEDYTKLRKDGVGIRSLVKFLGEKNWERPVKDALVALQMDAAQAHAVRLRKREERARLKAEEEKRKAAEAAEAERRNRENVGISDILWIISSMKSMNGSDEVGFSHILSGWFLQSIAKKRSPVYRGRDTAGLRGAGGRLIFKRLRHPANGDDNAALTPY
jgi:hypothetical protein